ncbi:MAG: hypothetical protein JXQ85_02060 [Cognatishimia sp.]|uniref:hypothetical protein n=1 Tax=Cognatishimia sp. TaxID=2211648 RepID=UPI003B8BBD7A
MKTTLIIAAATVAAAGTVHAFELKNAEITVGTSLMTFSDPFAPEKARNESISGALTFGIFDKFDLSVGATKTDVSPFDLDLTVASLLGMYQATDTLALGIFFDRTELTGFMGSSIVDHYGLEAAYQMGATQFRGFVGKGDYKLVNESSTVAGLDVVHILENGIDFGAFYKHEEADFLGKVKSYGVTVGVELDGPLPQPVYLNAAFGKNEGFFGDTNITRLTLTVPLGGATQKGAKPVHRHSVEVDTLSYFGDVTERSGF